MSLFRTPTPEYQQQPANGGLIQPRGFFGLLARLLRTPTPAYLSRPLTSATDDKADSR